MIALRAMNWRAVKAPSQGVTRLSYVGTNRAFIHTIAVADGSSGVTVDWGDGVTETLPSSTTRLDHRYSAAGTYIVTISDDISGISIGGGWGDSQQFTHFESTAQKLVNILPSCFRLTKLDSFSGLDRFSWGSNAFFNLLGMVNTDSFAECPSHTDFPALKESSVERIVIPSFCTKFQQSDTFMSCGNLKSVDIPSGFSFAGSYNTFRACTNLRDMYVRSMVAPSVNALTFGASNTPSSCCGYSSRGQNVLHVPAGATGYESSYWGSVLLNPDLCGFTIQYDL